MSFFDLHSPLLLLAAVVSAAIIIALIAVSIVAERKRREALGEAATALGLNFEQGRNRDLAQRMAFIPDLDEGENRYAFHVITGTYRNHLITAFDFHFETSNRDSKGNRSTSHHYRQVFVLHLGHRFPRLLVTPEGLFSKIAQAVGYEDIDFESHEFSRRFCVRSPDRKFAYDFLAPRVMELFLARSVERFVVDGPILAHIRNGRITPAALSSELDFLCDVRELLPDYLLAGT